MVDKAKIEAHVRGILIAIGENPDREGLLETPSRISKMYEEIFEAIPYSNKEIAEMFDKTFEDDLNIQHEHKDMVIVKNIDSFSHCEHHLALMYNMKITIAYIPETKILGLSKIARIAEMVCKRLQLQERIGTDIAEVMEHVLGTDNVAVIIKAEHGCMTIRGIKKPGTQTITTTLRGEFSKDPNTYNKLISLMNQ